VAIFNPSIPSAEKAFTIFSFAIYLDFVSDKSAKLVILVAKLATV